MTADLSKRLSIPYPADFPWSSAFGPPPMMVTGGYAGDITILDLSKGKVVVSEAAYPGIVWDVQWLVKSRTILSIGATERGQSSAIAVGWWDEKALTPKQHLLHHPKCLDAVLSPCGRFAALRRSRGVQILTLSDGTYQNHAVKAERCLFSPNGKWLAVYVKGNGPGDVRIWDVKSGTVKISCRTNTYVRSLLFTRDGSAFIVGELGGQVTIWSTRTWKPAHQFRAPNDADLLAYVEDRKLVAVYSYCLPEVGFFSITTGEVIYSFPAPDRSHILAYHDELESIVCDNFNVEVWNLPPRLRRVRLRN